LVGPLAYMSGDFDAAVGALQKKNSHPDKDDNDDDDRIFDQPGEPDPRSTMPLKFGIDRRHTLPRLLKNQKPAIAQSDLGTNRSRETSEAREDST
jgi:hypothetical protein